MSDRHNPLAEVEQIELTKKEDNEMVVVIPPTAKVEHNVMYLSKEDALSFIASLAVQLRVRL